jgi:hypothetical protein
MYLPLGFNLAASAETVPNTPRKTITVTVPAAATFGAAPPPAEPEPAA